MASIEMFSEKVILRITIVIPDFKFELGVKSVVSNTMVVQILGK